MMRYNLGIGMGRPVALLVHLGAERGAAAIDDKAAAIARHI
jgi:hypothetical protein